MKYKKDKKMNIKFNMNLRDIGGRLKAVRTALGMSIEKIAQVTGFSKGLISEAENGRKKPSSVYLYGLLDQFKVNINYILTGEGRMFLDRSNAPGIDDEIQELFFMVENVNLVKYAVLGFFIEYKIRNKDVIKELMENALQEEVGARGGKR
ncbi:MAG: helix-turn-helix transcriptional regulator [bacterium]|nr:helix-turn-helix transcriptional regulator [bacterium]